VKSGWELLLTLVSKTQTPQELDQLLRLLLTLEEQQQLAMRVQLINQLLLNDKPQREIAYDLQLSIAKVTRGSNALKVITDRLKKFLIKHLRE